MHALFLFCLSLYRWCVDEASTHTTHTHALTTHTHALTTHTHALTTHTHALTTHTHALTLSSIQVFSLVSLFTGGL